MKKMHKALRVLRYSCLVCVAMFGIVSIVGCGGGGEGDDSSAPPPAETSAYEGSWLNYTMDNGSGYLNSCCMLSNYTFETSYSGLAIFTGQCGGNGSVIDLWINPGGEVHGEIKWSDRCVETYGEGISYIYGECPTTSYCDGTVTTDIGELDFIMERN